MTKRQWLLASVVALVQTCCLACHVTLLTASDYQESAVQVSRVGPIQIGYLDGGHGASLALSTSRLPGRAPTYPSQHAQVRAMRHELLYLPLRAVLELAFYVLLVGGGRRLLDAWRRRQSGGSAMRASQAAAVFSLGLACLAIPLALLSYDSSLFSTWEGPGAGSFSGPYFEWSGRPGRAVSYRFLLEFVALGPLTLLHATGVGLFLPPMRWSTFFALVVPTVAFPLSLMVAWSSSLLAARWRKP